MAAAKNFKNSSRLLSEYEIVDFLAKSLKCEKDDRDRILEFIKKLFDQQFNQNTEQEMKDYMSWAANKGHVKVTSAAIPKDIVSGDCTLHDIRIESKGPDDKIYDRDAQLRAKVARGNCIMETTGPKGQRYYDLVIFALRKFTGGLGDEDDVDREKNEWEKYFLADIEKSKFLVSTTKANGEAAHLSCRWNNDSFLLCTGSKNVHLLFRKRPDICQNYGDARYKVAKEVSHTICTYLEELDDDLRNLFLSFLCMTRLTVVFEILQPDNQHIEDLSYLKRPLLKFITFTESKIYDQPNSLCYMPPHYCIEIAKLFELSCVDCKVLPFDQTEEHIKDVRKDRGYEGSVLYFMDENMNVIGILKKKTTWYIILRAIREKFKSYLSPKRNVSASELEKNIVGRLKGIQSWIGFEDNYFNEWKTLALKFAAWFTRNINSKNIDTDTFYNKYPTLWTRFLQETNEIDKFEMNPRDEDTISKDHHKAAATFNPQNFNKLCIAENYIPDEEDDEEINGEATVEESEAVKKIHEQLNDPTKKLTRKDKRRLKKKLKKHLKKSGDSEDDSDGDDALNLN